MSELADVIERVEAATEGGRELDARIHFALNPDQPIMVDPGTVRPPKRGASYISLRDFPLDGWEDWGALALTVGAPPVSTSIDAALTLMPKGWWLTLDRYCISDKSVDPFAWRVWLKRTVGDDDGDGPCGMQEVFAVGPTPPLALLAAILKARQAAAQPAKQAEAR